MQELSNEFEELFDPYLPVASKLKVKTCPALGVSLFDVNQAAKSNNQQKLTSSKTIEFSESDPHFNLEIPSSYHGKWKVRKHN